MAIPLPPDPYKALGVDPTAPELEIRKVYHKLVLKCHPDKIPDPTLRAQKTEEFHKIQEAWDLISDKTRREDYDEKVKINARSAAAFKAGAGAGASRQTRSATFPSPSPAGYNVYEASNANIFTAEPRNRESRRRRSPSPVRYTENSSRTRSYDDNLHDFPSHYFDAEPRMSKSASAAHSGRKPSAATMDRDRDRDRSRRDDDREQERYEKEKKKKEYASSQKSRDREKRSRTEEKSGRKSTFIVEDSPEEYDSRDHRSTRKADRGGDAILHDLDKMHITSKYAPGNKQKEDEAMQYISTSRSKVRNVPPPTPQAPSAVRVEEYRPRNIQRAETFSTYPSSQQRSYNEDDVHRSSARASSRRPSADAASPQFSDPMSPRIVTAEPPFVRKPTLQHTSSAPPIFVDRLPTRTQTLDPEPPRRPSAGTVPSMPRRAETFTGKYSASSPLKKSHRPQPHYSDDSDSSESDAAPYSRPQPTKRPSTTKVYKIDSRGPGKNFTAVVEEPVFVRKRSSSPPSRRSSEKPSSSSRVLRPKLSSQSSSRHYEEPPRVRVTPREVPGKTKTEGGSFYGEVPPKYDVQFAHYGEPKFSDARYDDRRSGSSSGMPGYAYFNPRRETVN